MFYSVSCTQTLRDDFQGALANAPVVVFEKPVHVNLCFNQTLCANFMNAVLHLVDR